MQWLAIFAVSLSALLLAAERFTATSEKIGLAFKIPPFIIGVTIIAFGTSLPEIVTSIISVLKGESGIVIGNVVGSNMANILLVIGITAVIAKELKVSKDILAIDLPILLGSTILLYITVLDGKVTYIEGILFLIALITYLVYNVQSHRTMDKKDAKELKKIKKEAAREKQKNHIAFKYPLYLILSAGALYFSADWTITAVIELGKIFKVSTEIIAITAVAIGTSLPELAVSASAAYRGKADIAIGNVMGSNIFNALGVMAIPSFFGDLEISETAINFSIPLMILITILYVFVSMDRKISKWEGLTFILIYIAFTGKVVGLI